MNKKPLLVASLLTALVASGSTAYAFGGPGGPGGEGRQGMSEMGRGPAGDGSQRTSDVRRGHGGVLRAAYRVDNLTADQRKQLDALRDKQRDRLEQARGERRALQEALDKGADAKTVRPLAEKEGKRVTENIMRQVELRDQVDKILTEAQRAQLKDLIQQPRGRGQKR